jgi:penicillin amidase
MVRKAVTISLIVFVLLVLSISQPRAQGNGQVLIPQAIPGLQQRVLVLTDPAGVPHIYAQNAHDLYLVTGYLHARDRLFQMDVTRRQASGTLAELLGAAALSSDVQTRTLGLRRAAELTEKILSDDERAELQAYADGVNAYIQQAEASGHLPPEYGALELSQVAPWNITDTLTVGKGIAFQLSFDLDVTNTLAFIGYVKALATLGLDGAALFSEDLFRSAPSETATIVPDAEGRQASFSSFERDLARGNDSTTLRLLRDYYQKIKDNPFFQPALRGSGERAGSNWWILAGKNTVSGFPLMANDPHLALSNPSVWYEIDQKINDGNDLNVIGTTFPGVPYVILGHNARISWSATVNPMDVTDLYSEKFQADAHGQLFSLFVGKPEAIQVIPQQYKVNLMLNGKLNSVVPAPPNPQIPPATLIIPRHGPIVSLDLKAGSAISVQYTGFYATREVATFRSWDRAQNLDDFKAGLATFEVGSQDWGYADIDGNIAYFAGAKLPLRQDLEQGFVDRAIPPFRVRDGSGLLQHQWIELKNPPSDGTIPFETLPPEEMPHTINPATGVIVSANNDPIGTTLGNDPLSKKRPDGSILYLNQSYDPAYRAQRITDLLREKLQNGKLSLDDMMAIQADVTELAAEPLVPFIIKAIANAKITGAPSALSQLLNNRIIDAGARLSKWSFATPTGITQGFDFGKPAGQASSQSQIDDSVATTIFNVWLGQFIANTIDATLNAISSQLIKPDNGNAIKAITHLMQNFEADQGVGASGLDFFAVPGLEAAPPAMRRDVVILKSLNDALNLLAGDAYASAFQHSKNLEDYRWGLLHKITFGHVLGGPFNLPASGGFPTDGGYQVIDRSDFDVRAATANGYSFDAGPSRRYVAELRPDGIRAFEVIPGGESGVPGSPHYADQVSLWLSNGYHPLFFSKAEVYSNVETWQDYVPASQ